MGKELEEYKYSNLELLREIWLNVPEGSQKIHQKHFDLILRKLNELQSIKEAEPSESLECLENMEKYNSCQCPEGYTLGEWCREEFDTIKQALLKAQEPKQYLKWEDLNFDFDAPTTMKVKMGDTQYLLSLRISLSDVKSVVLRDNNLKPILHLFEKEKQLFNNLHLEKVKE